MPFYLLDTNILIDLAGARHSHRFFDEILDEPGLRVGTSVLCVAEYMAGAGVKEGKFLKDWITADELEVLYLDSVEDAYRAAEFRKRQSLTLPDALILASALRTRAHLLTNDQLLLKKARSFIRVSDPLARG